MRSPTLLILTLGTVVVVGVSHLISLQFSLYYLYPWIDIPMHIFGGVMIALLIFLAPIFSLRFPKRYLLLIPVLAIVLIVGLLWEIFEIFIGIPLTHEGFEIDMLGDLTNDLVGGVIGYVVGSRIRDL